ncbi:tRNA (adenosine(37)-N6)-threonylcarbamoyltransferase complex transferase subunit TsaD [Patescibacteria group bacterium]|nr:MAG: tRNA (adenosine(37)-N6)-threonylcarbamoyltransferase complex transferase subunit TsaD [Patescibacteria group bacterium]
MRILGIETSCDETAVALVDNEDGKVRVVSSLVSSQVDIHVKYGGVVPEVAARSHVDVLFPLLEQLGVPRDGKGIDAIAVTAGPGLVPALRVGVEAAKTLAWAWKKPLVAVNHLEGHLYSVWLRGGAEMDPAFPCLALLVSGGHTELILMTGHGQYELLGATRDDAAGEAFDKVAKLLGLPYPGGPAISKLAKEGDPSTIAFPRPMLESGDLDFSFSGLKTAVAVYLEQHPDASVADVSASFQEAVVDTLVTKTVAAVMKHHPASVSLVGGVAANASLRARLGDAVASARPDATYHVPDLAFTGDNAAMIAAAGSFRALAKDFTDPLTLAADPNMRLAKRV